MLINTPSKKISIQTKEKTNKTHIFSGSYLCQPSSYQKKINITDDPYKKNHRFVFMHNGQCLASIDPDVILFFKVTDLKKEINSNNCIFLGEFNHDLIFAYELNKKESLSLEKIGTFFNLRILAINLSIEESNFAAKAAILIDWHKNNKFCSKCASKTKQNLHGQTRKCSNNKCEYQIFPKLNPAIIVLVMNKNHCLLGRQKNWPHKQFSTIAGFVEPAESIEDTVVREVFEETNIRVGSIKYHSSQPWPFPSSLMLGFTAVALSNKIKLNDNELEEAGWFSREDLASGLIKLPPKLSISRALINGWINDKY
ncbi:NAD(+) diphosphatase [Woeseiaceae bacterium]|jgi:NAD+ diphosphatase|nr:NAD(+) diphosphatase [Woeseiaceae bacterium]|tara:strand:+ start:1783 stop:2718 length:936 start_codon:yes stop_codon:yes gene_type:complete